MKHIKLIAIIFGISLLSSCLKDENLKRYTYYTPQYATAQEVRDNVKTKAAQPIELMGNMIVYNNYILAVEHTKGIHVIDASNLSAPHKIAFIPIPGCQNMAIRNNYLYANCYMDLFILDINDIQNVKLVNVQEDVFQYLSTFGGFRLDDEHIIVDWVKKDTMVTEEYLNTYQGGGNGIFFSTVGSPIIQNFNGGGDVGGGNSTGGSMARFTLVSDYLYTIDNNTMYSFSLSNPQEPTKTNEQNVGWNIETIFPFKDKLFIGSQTGMFIYNISNPNAPVKESEFNHVRSCDPVISNDKYAFVTLRSGTACQGFTNQMEVLNIENIKSPQLLKTYEFTNPHGLSLSGNTMFLCDGRAGLRVLDASDVNNIREVQKFETGETTDVITIGSTAYVITSNKILLYEFTSPSNVVLKGSINK